MRCNQRPLLRTLDLCICWLDWRLHQDREDSPLSMARSVARNPSLSACSKSFFLNASCFARILCMFSPANCATLSPPCPSYTPKKLSRSSGVAATNPLSASSACKSNTAACASSMLIRQPCMADTPNATRSSWPSSEIWVLKLSAMTRGVARR